jgi:hypothetical protein
MATERRWEAIPAQPILANGANDGRISVPDASLFKVKQVVKIFSDSVSPINFQVKRVIPGFLFVGDANTAIDRYDANLTLFTTADHSKVSADEQNRPPILPDARERAMFEEEPTVAQRSVLVDKYGRKFDENNPMPINVAVDNIQLLDKPYDSGTETYPTTATEIVTTFLGGLGGTPVQRVTLVYQDATKEALITFQRETWNGAAWIIG